MKPFEVAIFGIDAQTWIISLAVMLTVFAALLKLRNYIGKWMGEMTGEVSLDSGKLVRGIITRTGTYFLLAVSLYAGSMVLVLPPFISSKLGLVIFLLFLLQISQWGSWLITYAVNRTIKKKKTAGSEDTAIFGVVKFFLKTAMWAIIVLLALDNLGVNITALVAGMGVGGIAVALAAQKILSDLFGALSIVLDKPFTIGDFIEVGDLSGTVENIGIKNTRLRAPSGVQIIIPNSDLLQGNIHNYKDRLERREKFTLSVTYQTPLEKLKLIPGWLKDIIESQENARFGRAHFKKYGSSSLDFEILYWIVKPDYSLFVKVQDQINYLIYEKFEKENVEFAYPTQTLFMNQPKAAD